MTAGNHGDEMEGPIVARRLVDWLPGEAFCIPWTRCQLTRSKFARLSRL
ncbi:hypothetical protein NKH19_29630 [Mesorhizobium sp. M1338]